MGSVPDRLREDLAGARASHRALLAALEEARAQGRLDAAAPSRLPGWTAGHVLTHLARNADSVTRVLTGLAGGESVVERYVGGSAGRNADIEAGAGRPTDGQVADVRAAIERLERAWSDPAVDWSGRSLEADGSEQPVGGLLLARRREVEVHRVDLGIGDEPAGWPADYVERDLDLFERRWAGRDRGELPTQVTAAQPHERLAWLLGRGEFDGVEPAGLL